MKALWTLFWQICQLRRGPEDVPYSLQLLGLVSLLDFALGVGGQLLAIPERVRIAVLLTVLALAMDALVLWSLLHFKHLQSRWVQGLTTIYGVDLLMGLLAMPFTLLSLVVNPESAVIGLVVVAQMLLTGWNIGLRGFVFHRALNMGLLQGNMLSLALFLLYVFVSVQLFPELMPAKG